MLSAAGPNAPTSLMMISTSTASDSEQGRVVSTATSLEKLRIIKPFDERQLLNFYLNPLLDENDKFMQYFHERYVRTKDRNEYYSLILKLDRALERYRDIGQLVRKFLEDIRETESQCWTHEERRMVLSERCGDGQMVESSHTYERYNFDATRHQSLERFYYLLRERLMNENVVHSYFRKYFQLRFELVIFEACDIISRLAKKTSTSLSAQLPAPALQNDLHSPLTDMTNCSSSVFDDDTARMMANPINPETQLLKERLLELLAGMFTYYRRTNVVTDALRLHCYQAIVLLCRELSKIATFNDRLFILNQVLRCPSASSQEFAPLIDFPDPLPLKSTQYELGRQYVDYAITAIATILSPNIGGKAKDDDGVGKCHPDDNNDQSNRKDNSWLLVDDDLVDDEEVVHVSLADLTENDIIAYLARIPFRHILRFMSLINDQQEEFVDDQTRPMMMVTMSCTETAMIRLFAFNTKLIQIFRNGLQNFNCLRYKKLTLYIASMIKLIIKTISENWRWCKEKFTTEDQALLIRLQVEFDHFMLRSIMTILSSNRRGIWPLLSKIDFDGISEPMLWHILWVVYNNGRNENNEMVSGLCPYMSANYWKEKFRSHSQWKFVFIEKLSILALEEAGGLLDFFYNMAVSKATTEMLDYGQNQPKTTDDDFLREIVERFAEICLLKKCLKISDPCGEHHTLALKNQAFYSTKGVACLVKLIRQFKSMLVVLLNFLQSVEDASDILVQPCLDLFTAVTIHDWKPEPKFLSIIYKWLQEYAPPHSYNRFARILLSKVGWNRILIQSDQCLMVPVQQQHAFALKIHHAVENHLKPAAQNQESKTNKSSLTVHYPVVDRNDLNDDRLLQLAVAIDHHSFGCWCWSMLLSLRLHPLDLIPDQSCWDEVVFGNEDQDKYAANRQQKHWTMQYMARFNYDAEMSPLATGMENGNPYAIYIGAMISDLLFHSIRSSSVDLKKLTEINDALAKTGHFIPMLQILYHFLPFMFEFEGNMRSNANLIASLMTLLQNGYEQDLCSIILLQVKHFNQPKHSHQVCQAWTETLFECLNQCLNLKSTSWFASLVPQFLSSSSSIPNVIDSILSKLTLIFDRIAMGLLVENNWSILKLYLQYLTRKLYGRMVNWKLSHLESISAPGSPWYSSWMSADQCSISYLADKALIKSPWMTPFHLLLRHSLNTRTSEKHQQPGYLIFLVTEADIRRTYHVWNRLLSELRKKPKVDATVIESELENVCRMFKKAPLPLPLLPINLVTVYLVKLLPIEQNISLKLDRPHSLIPLLWRQFFSQYFLYSSDSLHAVGTWILDPTKIKALIDRLNALFDHHNQRWILMNNLRSIDSNSINSQDQEQDQQIMGANNSKESDAIVVLRFEDRLVKLYRAFRIWLKDERFLQYADLDDEQFAKPEIQIKLLISVVLNNKISDQQNIWEYLGTEFDHINSFFFLNYVDQVQLRQIITEHQQFWLSIVKHELENGEDFRNDVDESPDSDLIFFEDLENRPENTLVEYTRSEQFGQIIDYFQKLTSSLNCNILFIENDLGYNGEYLDSDLEMSATLTPESDISIVFVIVHQIVDNVVQEARFVENQLEKYSELNNDLLKDVLPKLYLDVRKEHRDKLNCDRAEFDASGCNKPAIIKFEFVESVLNNYMKQKYDRNRAEFEAIVTVLSEDVPAQKVVASIYFMSKICHYLLRFFDGDPKTETNQTKVKRLLETMTCWINSINSIGIKYHITGQLLDIFLEFLSKLSRRYIDEVNYFYLNTALQPSVSMNMAQQLAPCLSPSQTTPEMFIKMYKLLGSSLSLTTSQQTIFVLLSKFDVAAWLQLPQVTDEQRLDLLNCLFQCFAFFGTNPSDEFLVTYDLYRKHLQDMILFRFPMFTSHIINFMLQGMQEQVLAPALWNSVLHTFGFYTKSLSFAAKYQQHWQRGKDGSQTSSSLSVLDFDFKTFDEDLRAYLLRQKLFSSHELYDLLNLMIAFNQNLQQQMKSEFLDHFKIYNVKYLQFLTFISYCWISANSANAPDDLAIVWNPFFENWHCWIFPRFQTKFIQNEHFRFAWQFFIQCIQFLLDSFYDGQSQLLSCLWQRFMQFILETRSVEQSDVEMFETKLLQLKNWDKFSPGSLDIKLMYESVLSPRYSVDRLNSYVISRIYWTQVLLYSPISLANAIEVLDNLAYTIISLIDQPYIAELNFSSIPFMLLSCEKVKKIVATLLEVMKKRVSVNGIDLMGGNGKSTVHSKNFLIIIKLLRSVCQLSENELMPANETAINNGNQHPTKITHYAQCVGSLISYVCNHCTELVAQNPDVMRLFLKDSVEALRPTIDRFESDDRVSIFCELLQTLNEIQDVPVREKLSVYFVTIFSYLTSPEMFAEIMFAIGKIIYSIKTSIYLLECLIENYFDLAGDLNYLVDNLEIVHLNKHLNNSTVNGDEIEDFIMESVKTRSCLMLLIYIYRRLRHRTVPDICTRKYVYSIICQCASHLKFGQSSPINNAHPVDEAKICFFWSRIFDLLTFDHSSISETLNISVHHLTSLKSTPGSRAVSMDRALNSGSLIESPIVVYSSNNQNNSPSSLHSSPGSSRSSPTESFRLTLDIHSDDVFNAVQTLMQLCRSLNGSINDSMSRGFFSMFRQQKPVSEWFLFLLQCLVLHGVCTILESFFPDSFSPGSSLADSEKPEQVLATSKKCTDAVKSKLKFDLEELFRCSTSRLRSWKKNKQFQEIWQPIETMMELVQPPVAATRPAGLAVANSDESGSSDHPETAPENDGQLIEPFLIDDEAASDHSLADHSHQSNSVVGGENEPMAYMESMTKQWLRYYLCLQQHQQRRFHTIQRWLLECYFDHNYMKHFG